MIFFGELALKLALGLCLVLLVYRSMRLAQWMSALIGFSFIALTYGFITNDFSVHYIANNSNTTLPLIYRICAVWGAHEGSMLLWSLILAGWTFCVARFAQLDTKFKGDVIAILSAIQAGILLFILFTSNPFLRAEYFFPTDGADLNPLLQDPGLIIHPPILYMGYVGFAVPFAFALAGLIRGQVDELWAKQVKPWASVAWAFLTVGITLGSWWAYYELGWGGWWFWDPVENASFMPWLVGIALLHALMITAKRGIFARWALFLAITAFSLSLLGTFLVRSGVLTSVHAFATDPARGMFILIFLALVIGCALALFCFKGPQINSEGEVAPLSREAGMLYGGALLLAAAGTVLLGTLYPLLADALWQDKISVGPPYFDAVFIPLMLPIGILMALVPVVTWGKNPFSRVYRSAGMVALVSFAITLGIVLYLSKPILLGLMLSIWILLATLKYAWQSIREKGWSRRLMGMVFAHIGMAFSIAGVILTTQFDIEHDVAMRIGDTQTVGNYTFKLKSLKNIEGSNYKGVQGSFEVNSLTSNYKTMMYPEKRFFIPRQMPMSETALDAGFFRDLYVAMGEPLRENEWSIRIYIKPFVRWIWMGGLLMALGACVGART
jgi:cytochrome c-type biogenesis protein CcmF